MTEDCPCCSASPHLPRRQMLAQGLAVAALPLLPACAEAHSARQLDLVNMNTGERMRADFWHDGDYDAAVLEKVSHLLRDHRNNKVHAIDPKLLASLHDMLRVIGWPGEVRVISAYRSPTTNAKLSAQGVPVAKNSYHLKGQALDFRITGLAFDRLAKAALTHHKGGVGIYSGRKFLHLDSGPRRVWRG